ncbi:MAG: synthase [Ferruginibacter sp.]|jgi:homoserine O-succinyltransferase|uniref:type 1 glutamine amidotransferase n=1 Tax=Ferruginibacter sp. TaxID=1940288 RepID=UPI002658F234|nr:GMP synthase [Ferruginibacter sp.]MDB5280172.1 synthase [Ferruginibacter sp.]
MSLVEKKQFRIAILDLYEGVPNQGMRCIREIINQFSDFNNLEISWDEFDVRQKNEVPDLSYDIFISSGGPGSPLDSEGSEWEKVYFTWLHTIEKWNANEANIQKKYVFFICHSFQLACRHYNIGNVCQRKSTSFGVFPVHLLKDGKREIVFEEMKDPFYAVDSRDFQVIEPKHNTLHQLGATILAIEKERPHVQLERAIMAVRFNEYMIGTQFHPEADAVGMSMHLQTEDKKKTVIENYGHDKWSSMIEQLNDPDKIVYTYEHILPNFLQIAVQSLQPVEI